MPNSFRDSIVEDSDSKALAQAATVPESPAASLPRGNGEWILMAEDEESIRDIMGRTLEHFGYRALTAPDGAAAVALYAQHSEEIAVVLTDMMMPVMDGAATIHALRRINPNVKLIVATGSKEGAAEANAAGVPEHLFKPYTIETLLRTLHRVVRR